MSGVLRDDDVDGLVVQPDGEMEKTKKRRCVMEEREGGWGEKGGF
jgi:hypothetical protein